jgi:hypothetical protein
MIPAGENTPHRGFFRYHIPGLTMKPTMHLTLSSLSRPLALAGLCVAALSGACRERTPEVRPAITFSTIPPAGEGGSDRMAVIAGRVTGARPGQRLVLFAKSGVWWVQPMAAEPFTTVGADGSWKTTTHLGLEYAAVLVDAQYQPPDKSDALPQPGGAVIALATVSGNPGPVARRSPRRVMFSGYEWEVRQVPSDRGGENDYDPANAWVDAEGALHLRIAKHDDRWTSGEVWLTRSLGYGTYVFTVRDVSQLDPAAALGMFTWDDQGAEQNHRELDVEISRWGDPAIRNAQYVVQPYYLASNVSRFEAPPGRLTHAFRWEPGRATFTTAAGARLPASGPFIARRVFTSGVPVPGAETVHINLYYFRHSRLPLSKEVEVVIEKFQYLP